MPELGDHEYIAALFIDTGIGMRGGMGGLTPLSWSELKAFDDCGKLALSSWELSQLMEMSRSYCTWNAKGSQQKDIADDVPYIDRTRKATDYIIRQRDNSAKNAEDAKNISKG